MSVVLPRPRHVSPAVQRVRMARLCGHARNLAQETVRKRTGAASIENLSGSKHSLKFDAKGPKKSSARSRELSVADAAPGVSRLQLNEAWTPRFTITWFRRLADEAQTRSSACERP